MAVFKVNIIDSDFLEVGDCGEAIINTDLVPIAIPDNEGNTVLIMQAYKSPFMRIDMPYDVYAAIVCAGNEHLTTAAKLVGG